MDGLYTPTNSDLSFLSFLLSINDMIKVYKTFELSDSDWKQIEDGFNASFDAQWKIERMKVYYSSTFLGYSYHALDIDENGVLRGYNSLMPNLYDYDGKKIIVGVSGGTFVKKEFRKDVFIFKHLMDALFAFSKEENMVMKVGVPNHNSFKYALVMNKAKLVGYLDYYILPVRGFDLFAKQWLRPFNVLTLGYSYLMVMLSSFWGLFDIHSQHRKLEISLSEDYYDLRFRCKSVYKECKKGRMSGFYRLFVEKGCNVAYIMDFRENNKKTVRSLNYIVRQILLKEKTISAILYVGTLNVPQPLLIKVPSKMQPQKLPLTINVLNGDMEMEEDALEMKNWDFSLLNFDVR